jgi:hypothetical protein
MRCGQETEREKKNIFLSWFNTLPGASKKNPRGRVSIIREESRK